jgi:RNA polymerase sigma factor (sigma-70 family)
MKVERINQAINLPYLVENLIERKVHKLENMLHHFRPDESKLQLELSVDEAGHDFEIRIMLHLPGATLTASAKSETIIRVCGNAFSKLFESVEELKKAMRRDSKAKKRGNGTDSSDQSAERLQSAKSMLVEFYQKSYHRFYNYALREIRFRCYQGFTMPGIITTIDMLNEALATVSDRIDARFDENQARRLCYDEIRKAIDRHLNPRGIGMVPLEETIEPEKIDSDYQEYYQADEILKVEDIIIDENAEIPDHAIEYQEIETFIDRLLSQLPADWREAFILVEREGLPADEIAKNRGKNTESVLAEIAMAKRFLQEKLTDAGFEWHTVS